MRLLPTETRALWAAGKSAADVPKATTECAAARRKRVWRPRALTRVRPKEITVRPSLIHCAI